MKNVNKTGKFYTFNTKNREKYKLYRNVKTRQIKGEFQAAYSRPKCPCLLLFLKHFLKK